MLKTLGYSISSLSVLLLGAVSWDSAKSKPLLLACLIVGMATSIIGMACRWVSFLRERAQKRAMARAIAHEGPQSRLAPRPVDGRPDAAGARDLDRIATGA